MREATSGPLAVQIVPNDHPPFGDLCTTYGRAFDSLGVSHHTIALAPPRREALPGFSYLELDDVGRVRRAGRLLREALSGSEVVAICHRYRAYRVLRASGVNIPRVVAVAHEFGFFARRQRRIERRLFGRHVLFAGVSPAVQADLGITVEDPLCLPNAVDVAEVDRARVGREDALAALGVPASGALTIGLVGRLVRKKAPGLALETLRVLAAQGLDVRLLVVGDGPLATDLAASADGLPVTFCGFVPEARRLMAAFDVLLLTSEEVEAFGMVALEAMCAGVPVVTGPIPGPQFVLAGSGYYFNVRTPEAVAAAVKQVVADRRAGLLAERLQHARERAVREFSVAALARHLDELFFHGIPATSGSRQ
ncbi:MAG: glycosyltransferase [Pseudomonadales bacterium]